jgi:hypothetical protein
MFGANHQPASRDSFPPKIHPFTHPIIRASALFYDHNRFGLQAKTATTNGIFDPKKA